MNFYIEGKIIPINEDLVNQYINITNDSKNAMQLILTVVLRNLLGIDDPREILKQYSEVDIKKTLESYLTKEVNMLA